MIAIKLVVLILDLLLFFWIWRLESGWRIVITPFLFLGYFELTRVLPPFFLADVYSVTDSILPLLAASLAFGAMALGFLFVYGYRPVSRSNTLKLSLANVKYLQPSRGEKAGVLVLACFLVATGFYAYGGIPPVGRAVTALLTGGGDDIAASVSSQRYELTKADYFGGTYHGGGVLRNIQRIGWLLVVCYAMLMWVEHRRSLKRIIWFGAAVVSAWLFVAGDGTRGPFLQLLLVVIAVYSLRQPLKVRTVVSLFCVGMGIAILLSLYSAKMYYVLQQSSNGGFLQEAVSKIASRVFMANGMNDVRVVDMVNTGDFQLRWGSAHFREFATAIPGIQYGVPLSYELFHKLNPTSRGTVFLSGTYLSIVYLDFGWYGLVPIFGLIGLCIGYMQKVLFSAVRSPWGLSVTAVVAYLTVTLLTTGYAGFIAQMVVVSFIYGMHHVAARMSGRLAWRKGAHGRQVSVVAMRHPPDPVAQHRPEIPIEDESW